jgi:methyltransferase-like protein/2-polyprenyl-3-methyl-5-hydroxy-6-metoxy-1,4-benzoquinol methylase
MMVDHQQLAERYNAVPYVDKPHRMTHPRHIETMATLFGMQPAPIGTCRVLELGCAGGGNLIPQAQDLPDAEFVGIDTSQRQVEAGQETIRRLGLANIRLSQQNILDVDESWGQFDYILCHGVYSWVPPEVQNKILEICSVNLSPNGVALVSFNTYPGWHLRGMIRELMIYHTSQFNDPREQVEQAQAILELMIEAIGEDQTVGKLLRDEQALLRSADSGSYIYHEHLETFNLPCYFHEFMERASGKRLQYLADSNFSKMLLRNFPDKIRQKLRSLPLLQQEQYMDFLRSRLFRSTLLCREGIALERLVTPAKVPQFHVGLRGDVQVDKVDIHSEEPITFTWEKLGRLDVRNPLTKSALLYLREAYPAYVSFDELRQTALARLGPAAIAKLAGDSVEVLAASLLTGFGGGALEFCLHPPACSRQRSESPRTTPLVRHQAEVDDFVTNLRHEPLSLDALSRHVIRRLDGRHDRPALVGSLQVAIASGEMTVKRHNAPVDEVDSAVLSNVVDKVLSRFSRLGLLVD